jgi:hypothetical protein
VSAQAAATSAQSTADQAQASADGAQGTADAANSKADAITAGGRGASCNPTQSGTFVDCVDVTLSLARSGRVLLSATGGQWSAGNAPADGDCRFEVDDSTTAIASSKSPGEQTTDNTSGSAQNGLALTGLTDVLPAGTYKFDVSCDEDQGDTRIEDFGITAVRISG